MNSERAKQAGIEFDEFMRKVKIPLPQPHAWNMVTDFIPSMEPELYRSKSKFVAVGEFGQRPTLAVAYCFQSSLPGQTAKWMLDPDFYGTDAPWEIADQVIAWLDIPDLPEMPTLRSVTHVQAGGENDS